MTMKYLRSSVIALFGALIILSSCDSGDISSEEKVNKLDVNEAEIEILKQKITLGLDQKVSWKKHWESSVGAFSGDDFNWVLTDSIDPMEMPESNPILDGDPLKQFQFNQPEGNGTIDIYSYKVEAQESLDKPFLNPDSEVVWYRKDGMKERLLFMGPSGMFEDAMWMSPSEFLVLGYFQEEEGFRPMIWLIDLEDHTMSQFSLQKVSPSYETVSYLNKRLTSVQLENEF